MLLLGAFWSEGGQRAPLPLQSSYSTFIPALITLLGNLPLSFHLEPVSSPRACLLHHDRSPCVEILSKKTSDGKDASRILKLTM